MIELDLEYTVFPDEISGKDRTNLTKELLSMFKNTCQYCEHMKPYRKVLTEWAKNYVKNVNSGTV